MNFAIVLAGGTGSRMNIDKPKQFLNIHDKPIIAHTLSAFNDCPDIDKIIIVSLEEYVNEISYIAKKYNITKLEKIVNNGNTRQESVYNALTSINSISDKNDIVLIHDGVRAMIKSSVISQCIEKTKKYNCTTLAQKTKNTMILSNGNCIEKYLDRDLIYNIQTPQGFRYNIIYDSHNLCIQNNKLNLTDDTQIVNICGHNVHIIDSSYPNLKLTTQEDITLFEYYLSIK